MTQFKIREWSYFAKKVRWESLLIGNGASIAIHDKFSYPSLHEVASKSGRLAKSTVIFDKLHTKDFEHVLRVCWHAHLVDSAIGSRNPDITSAYHEVRSALIETVRSIHPDHAKIKTLLRKIGKFASGFDKVVSLNYDLLLYWAILIFNSSAKNWFKDAFIDQEFEYNWGDYLTKRFKSTLGSTMVFYPHGSLLLGTDASGYERKLVVDKSVVPSDLLKTITNEWRSGNYAPLFVSEGTSESKMASIQRSGYLSSVYSDVLTNLGKFVVAYGFGFGENDQHILRSLERKRPDYLLVSVYGGQPIEEQEAFCSQVIIQTKHLRMRGTNVIFFDSNSTDCWCN